MSNEAEPVTSEAQAERDRCLKIVEVEMDRWFEGWKKAPTAPDAARLHAVWTTLGSVFKRIAYPERYEP